MMGVTKGISTDFSSRRVRLVTLKCNTATATPRTVKFDIVNTLHINFTGGRQPVRSMPPYRAMNAH